MKTFNEICKEHNIEFYDIALKENIRFIKANGLDTYENHSFSTYNEIFLGIYDDNNLRTVSFFHELGHTFQKGNYTTLECELEAWGIGISLMKKYGYSAPEYSYKWAIEQLNTYVKSYNRSSEHIIFYENYEDEPIKIEED